MLEVLQLVTSTARVQGDKEPAKNVTAPELKAEEVSGDEDNHEDRLVERFNTTAVSKKSAETDEDSEPDVSEHPVGMVKSKVNS